MFKYSIGFIIFLNAVCLSAQILPNSINLNYGKVNTWKNDTLEFYLTNKSNTTAKLLPTYSPYLLLLGPLEILPFAKVKYKIVAYPTVKGNFDFLYAYYFSNQQEPIRVSAIGYVKGFDELAMFECPKIEQVDKKPTSFFNLKIVDSSSNKLIYHATTNITSYGNSINFEGPSLKLNTQIGLYDLTIAADGYLSKKEQINYIKSNEIFVIKMVPISEIPLIAEVLLNSFPDLNTITGVNEVILPKEIIKENEIQDLIISQNSVIISNPNIETNINLDIAKEYQISGLPPQHIIILADVSFSMKRQGHLDALKLALNQTIIALRPIDSLSIITFSAQNTILADHISATFKDSLANAIQEIQAKGGTNAKIAMKSAYGLANYHKNEFANTNIIIFTDGKFNTPGVSNTWYASYANERFVAEKIPLNILLFSADEMDINFMDNISNNGGGNLLLMKSETAIGDAVLKILMSKK